MPNGTAMPEATLGMVLEAMLGTTLEARRLRMMLGKAMLETRREATAKMRTRFSIWWAGNPQLAEFASMADDGETAALCLRSIPAIRHEIRPRISDRRRDARRQQRRCANGDGTTANPSNAAHRHETNLLFFNGSDEDLTSSADCPPSALLLVADHMTKQT
jgi:hypothetical protein